MWHGQVIAQSLTIARFVAKKAGLVVDSDEDMATVDMVVEQVMDCFISKASWISTLTESRSKRWSPLLAERSEVRHTRSKAKRSELAGKLIGNHLPLLLSTVERLLEKSEGPYLLGEKVSVLRTVLLFQRVSSGLNEAVRLQMTYGDLAIFLFWDAFANGKEMEESGFVGEHAAEVAKLLSIFPALDKLHRRVKKLPAIRNYLKRRPAYPY